MTNADKEFYKNMILGMSPEEQSFITRMLPSEFMIKELRRRNARTNETLENAIAILNNASEDMTLNEKQDMIKAVRVALKGA